ncbi:MAG: hypothetical protein AAFR96_00170 [Planctomycetota bacterium]
MPPKSGKDPYAHRRGEPRGFTVLWLAFLLAASGLVYGSIGSPMLASAEGYRFASKVLLTTVAVGMITIWPALRLSQASPLAGGASAAARDLAVVLIPMQALIWPQALITGWSLPSIAVIAVLLGGWAAIVGAIVGAATGPRLVSTRSTAALQASPLPIAPVWRSVAMFAVLALAVAGPAFRVFSGTGMTGPGDGTILMLCSPLSAPWSVLADQAWTGRHAVARAEHWQVAGLTAGIGISAWVVLLALRRPRPVADRGGSA